MSLPSDSTLLANEAAHGGGWTCRVKLWRTEAGRLGASMVASQESDGRSSVLLADGFSAEDLARRLSQAPSELDLPVTVAARAVSRAWATAGSKGWGRLHRLEAEADGAGA